MSHEYSASVSLSDAEVEQLRGSIWDAKYVLVSAPSSSQLLLRFGARSGQENWPEDIDVRFGDTIYVAMHTGTEAELTGFLRHLEARLRELGHVCLFEED